MATDFLATDIILMLSEVSIRKPFQGTEALEVSIALDGMLEILNSRRVGRNAEEHADIVTQLTGIRDLLRPDQAQGDAGSFYRRVHALDTQLNFIEAMSGYWQTEIEYGVARAYSNAGGYDAETFGKFHLKLHRNRHQYDLWKQFEERPATRSRFTIVLDNVRSARCDTDVTVEVILKSGAILLLATTNSGVAKALCKDVRVQCMRLGIELEHHAERH